MMEVRKINRQGREWCWPAYDTELIRVFEQVSDVALIMPHVQDPANAVCIQAGGACGVWPIELAGYFKQVVTFEPDALNFHCLAQNVLTSHTGNIDKWQGALSDRAGYVAIMRDEFEKANAGAGYVFHVDQDPMIIGTASFKIDDLALSGRVGLIQLDVEGFELHALRGAAQVLQRDKPVVVIEEKKLPHMKISHTAARDYLVSLGYVQASSFHRDVLFVHGGGQ